VGITPFVLLFAKSKAKNLAEKKDQGMHDEKLRDFREISPDNATR
jgi:hypothetical protein